MTLDLYIPADDILVLKDPEHPDWMWSASISEIDGRYLELVVTKDSSRVRAPFTPFSLILYQHFLLFSAQKYLVWVADLKENEIGPNLKWIKLIDEFDASYDMLVLFIQWGFLRSECYFLRA